MVGIFWASCPKCDGEFMAQSADFRGTENKMMCPVAAQRRTARGDDAPIGSACCQTGNQSVDR